MRDASSRRGGRNRRKAATGKAPKIKRSGSTDWDRLKSLSAPEIRKGLAADPEVSPTDAAFWKHATVVWPTRKEVVTMRLDADLLRWFRQHPRYQTRINAILRAYMAVHSAD